ncbi:SLC13 family permease [Ornithinimicrobium sp. Y1694]|uniref:SLC13 family permease n=1 Tax=Ornithinimicrobium sp. Y1694 TaxID=3418590 RepID=UPI003CF627C5
MAPRTLASRIGVRRGVGLLLAIVLFILPLALDVPGLDPAGERMLAIFLVAIVLFVTEAIPLFATAALIILLQVLMLSEQALVRLTEPSVSAREVYASLADPVIILFLGGFLIADGAAKYRFDRNLAALVLTPFRSDARRALLALMLMTAGLSLFMSNTATAATMFAVLLPVLAVLPDGIARTGFALSIPLAANLGGIGTPVASPPNALAVAAITSRGESISFLSWMLATVPLMIILLALGWLYLSRRYLTRGTPLDLDLTRNFDTSLGAWVFYAVAATTIVLWLSEPLHGIPATTVGFLPVVVLLATTVMSGDDLRALQWPVLWLVAGGIALGNGVIASGLDGWLVGLVSWENVPAMLLLLTIAAMAWAMSNLLSNSATANLLIPIGLTLAVSIGQDIIVTGVLLAVACSLGMVLPVSTPPNAIAYATGTVKTGDLAVMGVLLGVVGVLLVGVFLPWWGGVIGLW